jgi:amino acid permease
MCSNLGLAFIAHYNAPVYYREMRDKKDFKKMVTIAFSILTLLYASTMAFGMKTFGDVCQGNIILNYHPKDVLSTLGRVATFFSILFGFPLTFCGIREGMQGIAARFNWTSVLENR